MTKSHGILITVALLAVVIFGVVGASLLGTVAEPAPDRRVAQEVTGEVDSESAVDRAQSMLVDGLSAADAERTALDVEEAVFTDSEADPDRVVRFVHADGSVFAEPVRVELLGANGQLDVLDVRRGFVRPSALLPQGMAISPQGHATTYVLVGRDGAVDVAMHPASAVRLEVHDGIGRPAAERIVEIDPRSIEGTLPLGWRDGGELALLVLDAAGSRTLREAFDADSDDAARASRLRALADVRRQDADLFADGARVVPGVRIRMRTDGQGVAELDHLSLGCGFRWRVRDLCSAIEPAPVDGPDAVVPLDSPWSGEFQVLDGESRRLEATVVARGVVRGYLAVEGSERITSARVSVTGRESRHSAGSRRGASHVEELLLASQPIGRLFPFEIDRLHVGSYELEMDISGSGGQHLRFTTAFDIDPSTITDLGVLESDGHTLTIEITARDLNGRPLDLETLLDPQDVQGFVLSLGEHEFDPDWTRRAVETLWWSADMVAFDCESFGPQRVSRIAEGSVLAGVWFTEDSLRPGWGVARDVALAPAIGGVDTSVRVEVVAFRATPLRVRIVKGDFDGPFYEIEAALVDERTGLVVFGGEVSNGGDDEVECRYIEFERAPVGTYRFLGRTEFEPYEDGGSNSWGSNAPTPSGVGALLDARLTVADGQSQPLEVPMRVGCTIRGAVPAHLKYQGDWVWIAPTEPGLRAVATARVWAYIFSASDDEEAAGLRGSWYGEGLLPHTTYEIGRNGRRVTTGAEGTEIVVELTDEDFDRD